MVSTRHCMVCSDQPGGRVCFLTSMLYIRTCVPCQGSKRSFVKPCGLLQPLHLPYGACDSVLTDSVTGLPKTKAGHDAVLVFDDRLTKSVHIGPTTTKCTAKTWADLFIQHVFCNHGLPLEVISDRDPQFAGKYNQSLCDGLCISWNTVTAFHPQTDGQTERMNCTVEAMLRHLCLPPRLFGLNFLVRTQFDIINAWQEPLQNTPFYLDHGRHPRTPLSTLLGRGTCYLQKVSILLLLLLDSTCKTQRHVPKHACSMHSKGRNTTRTKGMSHLSLWLEQKCPSHH